MLKKCCTQYGSKFAKLSSSQWPQDWTRSVFIPIPKKGNAKECSNYHTIALISHISKVKSLSRVQLFATPWIAAHPASLSITISRSSLKFTSIELVMPSSHLIFCRPLLLLPTMPPASGSFPMSQLQSIGVSALASFLPKKSQGWSPSEWTGWISS